MFRFLTLIFKSPEKLLSDMSRSDMNDALEEGGRIIINADGAAAVNFQAGDTHKDFALHVSRLKDIPVTRENNRSGDEQNRHTVLYPQADDIRA